MTLQVSQTVAVPSSGALTTPTGLVPAATDTISQDSFGPNGLIMLVVTTGTTTDVTVLDPGVDAMGHRALFIPRTAIAPSTGNASITFSGARTGVTYYLFRA
jgi:hypothetical protein